MEADTDDTVIQTNPHFAHHRTSLLTALSCFSLRNPQRFFWNMAAPSQSDDRALLVFRPPEFLSSDTYKIRVLEFFDESDEKDVERALEKIDKQPNQAPCLEHMTINVGSLLQTASLIECVFVPQT